MAKATLSHQLSSISGTVGGTVYRTAKTGTQLSATPSTRRAITSGSYEQAINLATDTMQWRLLTSAQRTSWKDVARVAGLSVRQAWLWARSWFRATMGMTTWQKVDIDTHFSYSQCMCYSPAYHIFVFIFDAYWKGGMWSADGYHWTAFTTPQTSTWRSVKVYAQAAKFVAVSSNGARRVMTSWDGITWELHDAASASEWLSLDYATDIHQWCAVATSGSYRIMTSPDGVTWTGRAAPVDPALWCVCRSPELGLWVALGSGASNQICVSSDGVTWANYSISGQTRFVGVVWAPELGMFCAVSSYGSTAIFRSYDGVNWVGSGGVPAGAVSGITWSSSLRLFVATFSTGAYQIATSPDGITWTKQIVASSAYCGAVVWSDWHAMFLATSIATTLKVVNSPITLEPTKTNGTPLLLDYSDKQWTTLTQTPILTLAQPQPELFTWKVTEVSGVKYLSLSVNGEIQSGANQTYMEVFVSRPLNAAENNYNGVYKRAGILWMQSAPFTSEELTYPWSLPLSAGTRLSFRLRYLSRGCRISPSVKFNSTIA